MKITVLSGGSGNDAILKGIKYYYPECDLKVITNAYDNGKSTGICRYVTDTLGVSDIRKNHTRMYKIMTPKSKQNQEILDFYDKRYDFTKGKEKEEILDILNSYGFVDCVIRTAVNDFFKIKKSKNVEYKDFSIANIVYSAMYKKYGYEDTNKYFCNILDIDDFVLLNSFDNIYLKAQTESGYIIQDEGELVDWSNKKDKIVGILFDKEPWTLNPEAVERIMDSDLIIHSTGTFWSSIYPTMYYGDFYKIVNKSKAKKIWIMNTEEDKDAFGVSALDFMRIYENLGLDMKQWDIIQNLDATKSLKCLNWAYNFKLGNNKGKNDYKKVGKAIFKVYYELYKKFDKILLDFDDTIVGRQGEYPKASKENLKLVQKKNNIIISCNFYKSLKESCAQYGYDIDTFENEIWANVNTDKYIKGKIKKSIKENKLKDFKKIKKLIPDCFQDITDYSCKYCIKIKPLSYSQRDNLSHYLNKKFKEENINAIASLTGRTTVDILSPCNKKGMVWYQEHYGLYKTLYIGDEILSGNDSTIACCCDKAIEVKNPVETNIILKLVK